MNWNEAKITINGQELSIAESMTVRCAVTSFLSDISKNGLGNDETGKDIAEGYIRHSTEVLKKIGVITNEKKTETTRVAQQYEIDECVVVQGWSSTATGIVKDIQWAYHNRLQEYTWHYLIGFDENQKNPWAMSYIPEGYLKKQNATN